VPSFYLQDLQTIPRALSKIAGTHPFLNWEVVTMIGAAEDWHHPAQWGSCHYQ